MIRFLLRFLGLIGLATAFIFLVYDGARSIAAQQWLFTSVGSFWSMVHQNSLLLLQPAVERYVAVWAWQAVLQPYVLEQPVWIVVGVLGMVLILLGRKKRRLIGYARD